MKFFDAWKSRKQKSARMDALEAEFKQLQNNPDKGEQLLGIQDIVSRASDVFHEAKDGALYSSASVAAYLCAAVVGGLLVGAASGALVLGVFGGLYAGLTSVLVADYGFGRKNADRKALKDLSSQAEERSRALVYKTDPLEYAQSKRFDDVMSRSRYLRNRFILASAKETVVAKTVAPASNAPNAPAPNAIEIAVSSGLI